MWTVLSGSQRIVDPDRMMSVMTPWHLHCPKCQMMICLEWDQLPVWFYTDTCAWCRQIPMMPRLATDYAKNYCNRTLIVKVIVENVVTCFFMGHSVVACWTTLPSGFCLPVSVADCPLHTPLSSHQCLLDPDYGTVFHHTWKRRNYRTIDSGGR